MNFLLIIIFTVAIALCIYRFRYDLAGVCKNYVGGKQYSWKKKTEIYDKYRPRYNPDSIKDSLEYTKLDICKSVIVDIGSGTGILTRQLAEYNPKELYAIDPDPDMISMSKRKKTRATHMNGFSNLVNLPDNSVDIITIGTALHWFDPDSTLAEFKRILKQSGYIMVFNNGRRYKTNNNDIQDAEDDAWEKVSHARNSTQTRYKWRLDDISDTYNIVRRSGYTFPTKLEYINTHLSQSRAPTESDKYKQLLSDIYDKYTPQIMTSTRVVIMKI
jgi:ubiquinone/menaquinone biosynthesis C-methylase UbiE